jgi:hypothetical protein
MERVLGSRLLRVIVIDFYYKWMYKKVLIKPITQSKPVIISHAHKLWQYETVVGNNLKNAKLIFYKWKYYTYMVKS